MYEQVLSTAYFLDEGPPLTTRQVRILTVLKEIPFVLPFQERVIVFQGLLLNNKLDYQNESDFMVGSNIHITIRRNYLYEDAFEKLSVENGNLITYFVLVLFFNILTC